MQDLHSLDEMGDLKYALAVGVGGVSCSGLLGFRFLDRSQAS